MTLEEIILSELQQVELNGIRMLRVMSKPEGTQIIFEIPPAIVEFVVNDDYRYQILKVTYQQVVYQNHDYLSRFNPIVTDVIKKVKPIEMVKRAAFAKQQMDERIVHPAFKSRLEVLEQREQSISEKEALLEKKEREIKAREEGLNHQEQTLALKRVRVIEEKNARKIANRERTLQKMKKSAANITYYVRKRGEGDKRKLTSKENEEVSGPYSEQVDEAVVGNLK